MNKQHKYYEKKGGIPSLNVRILSHNSPSIPLNKDNSSYSRLVKTKEKKLKKEMGEGEGKIPGLRVDIKIQQDSTIEGFSLNEEKELFTRDGTPLSASILNFCTSNKSLIPLLLLLPFSFR